MSLTTYENEFIANLLSIPSVGGDPEEGAPYGKMPRKALQFFLDEAQKEGFSTGIIDDKAGYVEFGSGSKMIGIVCHLDVVPSGKGWTFEPFAMTVKDGVIYGRGIVDDKGPACASFFAMRDLKNSGFEPQCRIRLILGSDEERTCDCVETYAAKGELPDTAITPDSQYPVIYAEKGILQIRISDSVNTGITANAGNAANMVPNDASLSFHGQEYKGTGKISHAAVPEGGINAIMDLIGKLDPSVIELSPLLRYINENIFGKKYSDYTGCVIEDDSGFVTANPAILRIDGNGEELVIDIRYPVTAKMDDIIEYFRNAVSPYGLTVDIRNHMGPLYKKKDTPEIKALTEVWKNNIDRFDGFKESYRTECISPIATGGGTYARHMPNTIAFGIMCPWQEDQCHRADEHMSVNDFEANKKVLTEAIVALSAL